MPRLELGYDGSKRKTREHNGSLPGCIRWTWEGSVGNKGPSRLEKVLAERVGLGEERERARGRRAQVDRRLDRQFASSPGWWSSQARGRELQLVQ